MGYHDSRTLPLLKVSKVQTLNLHDEDQYCTGMSKDEKVYKLLSATANMNVLGVNQTDLTA